MEDSLIDLQSPSKPILHTGKRVWHLPRMVVAQEHSLLCTVAVRSLTGAFEALSLIFSIILSASLISIMFGWTRSGTSAAEDPQLSIWASLF